MVNSGLYYPIMIRTIIESSIEYGINWFDTAEVYGWGQSEEALAKALIAIGDPARNIVIATKWWQLFSASHSITSSINKRLEYLSGRTIVLAMAKLINNGQIRYAGVSNFSAKQMKQAHQVHAEYGYQLVSNQGKRYIRNRSRAWNELHCLFSIKTRNSHRKIP